MEKLLVFQDAVQRDLSWRKVEISSLKTAVHLAQDSDHYIFRSGQVLLCAHWEGFLKKSANIYIEHALSQNIKLRELTPQLVAVAFYKPVMQAAEARYPGSSENHIRLAQRMLVQLDERPNTHSAWTIDTEGNPGTEVVERILKSIGIDSKLGMNESSWSTTKAFINEKLLKDRNAVAHGQGMRILKPDLIDRVDRTLRLLDQLRDSILDAASNRQYMR